MSARPVEPPPTRRSHAYSHAALLATTCSEAGCARPAPFYAHTGERVCGMHALDHLDNGSDTRQNP